MRKRSIGLRLHFWFLASFVLAQLVFGAGICQQGSTFRVELPLTAAPVPSPCLA
jgi:hypothetical protein